MKNIFFVEDDQAIASNLVLLLHSEGFAVTHAPARRPRPSNGQLVRPGAD